MALGEKRKRRRTTDGGTSAFVDRPTAPLTVYSVYSVYCVAGRGLYKTSTIVSINKTIHLRSFVGILYSN